MAFSGYFDSERNICRQLLHFEKPMFLIMTSSSFNSIFFSLFFLFNGKTKFFKSKEFNNYFIVCCFLQAVFESLIFINTKFLFFTLIARGRPTLYFFLILEFLHLLHHFDYFNTFYLLTFLKMYPCIHSLHVLAV